MLTDIYDQAVVKVSYDKDGKSSLSYSLNDLGHSPFNYENKLFHVKNGDGSLLLWLGPFQTESVIASLVGTCKKKRLPHALVPVNFPVSFIDYLFKLLGTNGFIFMAVAKLCVDSELGLLRLTEKAPSPLSIEVVAAFNSATHADGSNDDNRIVSYFVRTAKAIRHIIFTGFSDEILADKDKTLGEISVLVGDVDRQCDTDLSLHILVPEIAVIGRFKSFDLADGNATSSVFVPFTANNNQCLPWDVGTALGASRMPYPSEVHGKASRGLMTRSATEILAAAAAAEKAASSGKTKTKSQVKRKLYGWTVSPIAFNSTLVHCGEVMGATALDSNPAFNVIQKWLDSQQISTYHVVQRIFRSEFKDANKDYLRHISRLTFSIYTTLADRSKLRNKFGLSGRDPGQSDSAASAARAIADDWQPVTNAKKVAALRDFDAVLLGFPLSDMVLMKDMYAGAKIRFESHTFRHLQGVIISYVRTDDIPGLMATMRDHKEITLGLQVVAVFVAHSQTAEDLYESIGEIVVVTSCPNREEVRCQLGALEGYRHLSSMGLYVKPFHGTFKSEPWGDDRKDLKLPDGNRIPPPVTRSLLKSPDWTHSLIDLTGPDSDDDGGNMEVDSTRVTSAARTTMAEPGASPVMVSPNPTSRLDGEYARERALKAQEEDLTRRYAQLGLQEAAFKRKQAAAAASMTAAGSTSSPYMQVKQVDGFALGFDANDAAAADNDDTTSNFKFSSTGLSSPGDSSDCDEEEDTGDDYFPLNAGSNSSSKPPVVPPSQQRSPKRNLEAIKPPTSQSVNHSKKETGVTKKKKDV